MEAEVGDGGAAGQVEVAKTGRGVEGEVVEGAVGDVLAVGEGE